VNAHTILEKDGHTLDVVTHPTGQTRLIVSRTGAEMIGLQRHHAVHGWVGFLWNDGEVKKPASGWSNHSTVMGYFLHRLVGERTTYQGHEIKGGNHSFLRAKKFNPPHFLDGPNPTLRYRIEPDQILPQEYPYRVTMELDYQLLPDRVMVTFRFINSEAFPTHVTFGLHPGFAVSALSAMHLRLPEGRYVRHLAPGNFLSGEVVDFHHEDRETQPFTLSDLPNSYLFELISVADPVVVMEDPASHRRLKVHLEDCPYLTLWSDGNPFICIEPCWGLPDHHEQRPFEQKLGIQVIPAGGKREAHCAFEIEVI
jgi:galactose mutarotase-like enzyme